MIELEAAFTKQQLKIVFALKGKANADSVQLGDGVPVWPPGTLCYVGFIGRRHDDGLYHGICRFEADTRDLSLPIERRPFTMLLQWINREAPTDVTIEEEIMPNGIHSDDNEVR